MAEKVVLIVHGGAGSVTREGLSSEREARCRETLEAALRGGHEALRREGGTALDAVEAAIRVLEDSPLFNAGRGGVYNRDGRHELDAAIMEGARLRAGAVAVVTRVRNPVSAARAVMERSGHVLLAGPGADRFAEESGLEIVPPDYFATPERWEELQGKLAEDRGGSGGSGRPTGTVGAVALGPDGTLAAGASTGGTTGKRPGRVGDSPLVGAGVYAEDGVCAVSCTGDGESFIRLAMAHEIVALVKYRGLDLREAASRAVHEGLARVGGEGGVIALGPDGQAALPFHAAGMYRGTITESGTTRVAIFREADR
jgi:beta-aspartyl-peptidase (threonine type)